MSDSPLLYYITDRTQFPGDEAGRRLHLLNKIREAARCGVDLIQLREKDLGGRELEQLAAAAAEAIREAGKDPQSTYHRPGTELGASEPNLGPLDGKKSPAIEMGRAGNDKAWIHDRGFLKPRGPARFLINSRCDIALAVGACGVHLRSDDISIQDARSIAAAALTRDLTPQAGNFVVGISCHCPADVSRASAEGADFAVLAPIFEKREATNASPSGIDALHQACRHNIAVLALGGVTLENARLCLAAGAAGIAGIRLFQEHDISAVVRALDSYANR